MWMIGLVAVWPDLCIMGHSLTSAHRWQRCWGSCRSWATKEMKAQCAPKTRNRMWKQQQFEYVYISEVYKCENVCTTLYIMFTQSCPPYLLIFVSHFDIPCVHFLYWITLFAWTAVEQQRRRPKFLLLSFPICEPDKRRVHTFVPYGLSQIFS